MGLEGKEQALYFDAHVLDAQRRRHDVRGCRCRFLVRYDHDQSEEIVPLRKICRRPETDYRLQGLNGFKDSASVPAVNSSTDANSSALKTRRQRKADGAAAVTAAAIVDTGTATVAPPTTTNESQTTETTVAVKGEGNKVAPDRSTTTTTDAYSIVTGENETARCVTLKQDGIQCMFVGEQTRDNNGCWITDYESPSAIIASFGF
ncbi:hypothetical protein ACLOJK_041756 [Asimina triloba]